jgi:Tat protein secretion system quality control protein TatD with DNase activity
VQELLSTLPAGRIFLETDNSSASIEEIYSYAASAFQIDEESLSLQLQKNAATVFGAALTIV